MWNPDVIIIQDCVRRNEMEFRKALPIRVGGEGSNLSGQKRLERAFC